MATKRDHSALMYGISTCRGYTSGAHSWSVQALAPGSFVIGVADAGYLQMARSEAFAFTKYEFV